MKKLLLFFSLVFISTSIFAQGKWSFSYDIQFDRYTTYEGTIDNKYPIKMRIEESGNSCSSKSTKWTPRLVYGWYMYTKIGTKIPLVGHVCYSDACESYKELFVPSDPIDYSFDNECEMIDYKEKFTQQKGAKNFTWNQKGGKTYPVNLNVTHEFSWLTKATLGFKINNLTIAEFNLTELSENKYIEWVKIIAQKRVAGKYYLLFEYSQQSNPGSYGYGVCGAGIEQYVAHLIINENFEIESFDKVLHSSCINDIYDNELPYNIEKPELGLINQN
ncbi:hypothetical protein [Marinigracilibium pacificum]|uniref:GLPGLI family protein n=1 Tax=Marinigracilibium pacificum TaxID=2729599 RepID=A0A848IVA2_9BACT|nr:hypothetical protein [Marinigracilibium pacificum]NMM47616.1 hypothetical protein [Marinigracilibium pacificum]